MENFLYSEYEFEFRAYVGNFTSKIIDFNDDEILVDVLYYNNESNKMDLVVITIPNQNKLVDYHVPITKLYFFKKIDCDYNLPWPFKI